MKLVRKLHVYDGSPRAGKPTGPVLKVTEVGEHRPVDGNSLGKIYFLSDGTWAFPWLVKEVNEFETNID